MASRRTFKRKLNTSTDNEISESSAAERKKHIKIDDDGGKDNASLSSVVVFVHGAGAPSSSDWMTGWRVGNEEPLSKQKNWLNISNIVKKTAAKYPCHPLILAGKSMGSRISCMVASEIDTGVSAVICLGYPLKGINGVIWDETLVQLAVPTMFVQGSKDGLCPLEKLEAVRGKMKCSNSLHVIDGGDHSFKIAKKHQQSNGSTQQEAEDLALLAISAFVSGSLGGSS